MIKEKKYYPNMKQALTGIENYFKNFHPAGYGTTATIAIDLEGLYVIFERFESCD